MGADQQQGGSRFLVKQVVLLVITVVLVVFFTIPLLQAVRAASNPARLAANADDANKAVTGLQAKVDVVRSKMLMAPGDDEAQEKLRKQVEELQRQMALKEQENKNLQEQMALVQTMLQVFKPASTAPPPVDFWHKLVELAVKVIGCIGSLFSGCMFVISWWRKRTKGAEAVAS